jgi:hypothetical protein
MTSFCSRGVWKMRANPCAGRIERRAVLLEKVNRFSWFNIFRWSVCVPGVTIRRTEKIGQGSTVDSGQE